MAALFVLLLLGSGLIFLLQNRDPVLLYFLGNSDKTALLTLSLPVGLWVISFIILGVLISLLLQGLSSLGKSTAVIAPRPSSRPRAKKAPKPPVSPPSPKPSPQTAPQKSPPIAENWNWENPIPEADDWEVEDTPRSPSRPEDRPPVDIPARPVKPDTVKREKVERQSEQPRPVKPVPSEPPLRPEDLKEFETSQPPKTTNREGNIYSYTYREKGAERPPKSAKAPVKAPTSKQVYDADYRVINPPLRSPETTDWEEDEDWV